MTPGDAIQAVVVGALIGVACMGLIIGGAWALSWIEDAIERRKRPVSPSYFDADRKEV